MFAAQEPVLFFQRPGSRDADGKGFVGQDARVARDIVRKPAGFRGVHDRPQSRRFR